ncbi:MAG: 30S ribosomal protein S8, partial [Candidatus Zixiibacteriota bacterium]
LKEERYVNDVVEYPDDKQGVLRIFLRYNKDDESVISGIQRISRPGLRRYVNSKEAPYLGRHKMGITIVSTSSGVMTNKGAGQKRAGGELLCRIW